MLEVKNISKKYGSNQVLKNIDLKIKKGEIFGLVGKNGAGKTTLLSIIAGLCNSTDGSISISNSLSSNILQKLNVGYLPDVPMFFDFMTVKEYIEFLYIKKPDYHSKAKQLIKLVNLEENTVIKTMSRGMRQRLGMAATLVNEPDVILLDEPSSALDPMGRYELSQILLELKQHGKIIILSTHILTDMETICDRVGFLHNGSIVKIVSPKDFGTSNKYKISFDKPINTTDLSNNCENVVLEDEHTIIIDLGENVASQKKALNLLMLVNSNIRKIEPIQIDLDTVFREVCI